MGKHTQKESSWRPCGFSFPQLLLIGLIISMFLALFAITTTSTAGFSPYNPSWDGTGEFSDLADDSGEKTVITTVDQYESIKSNSTIAFVIAPEREYSDSETETIRRFVQNGGLLVVADSYGPYGNVLLAETGASAMFDGRILRDEQHNFRSSSLPTVTASGDNELISNVDSLTINYGTAVQPGTAKPIANSSEVSYLARNQSATLGSETRLRSYPVVTTESIGEGTVVAVGDPSIFISSMLDRSDNKPFASTLFDQRSTILIDQSHSSSPPPVVAAVLALQSSPLLAGGVLTAILFSLVVVGRWHHKIQWLNRQTWLSSFDPTDRLSFKSQHRTEFEAGQRPLTSDPQAIKERLQEQHPEWDEDQIDRIIAGVLSDYPDNTNNERH